LPTPLLRHFSHTCTMQPTKFDSLEFKLKQ
jgi:hypothetical protein